jgi:hypothetical protein
MKKSLYIDPFETQEVTYWSRKWHISPAELFTAIMNTGSNHISILQKALMPYGSVHHIIRKIVLSIVLKLRF